DRPRGKPDRRRHAVPAVQRPRPAGPFRVSGSNAGAAMGASARYGRDAMGKAVCVRQFRLRARPPLGRRVSAGHSHRQRRRGMSSPMPVPVAAPQPLWYKDAVIYQLHVKTFADSNGDGIGDFKGLSSRLNYLADLGITCLWLLPMYPSPFRDDGYDI